ncbi:MAG: glycerophosphodiester phosphodiesterase [Rhodothermales bacterium]
MADTTTPFPLPAFDLQGHRGARGLLPENTIPAFLKALDIGVTTLEMDVVISKDLQVVVSHDPWFSSEICTRPDGQPVPPDQREAYKLFEMTYKEIARYDCGSRGNPRFPGQEPMRVVKPLLKDVIAAAEAYVQAHNLPAIFYNIETKSTPRTDRIYHPEPALFTELLYDVLSEAGITQRATIQSFDVRTLRVARRLDPHLRVALLVSADEDRGFRGNIDALGFAPDIYSPQFTLVDEALVAEAHARQIAVIPWTINALEDMQRLKALGIDGLITDFPDIGIALLNEDGSSM